MTVDTSMRLDRLLSALAVGTRSQVRDIIRCGRVSVNDQTERSADRHVVCGDRIFLDGCALDARLRRFVMLNKPCGILTAARDARQKTVLDLLPPLYAACSCMPVGRLDKDTEGLLLLTTDGTLAHRLLSPKSHVWKCYLATVDGPLADADATAFAQGLSLSDFDALPARLRILRSSPSSACAQVEVQEGKYHQVRRMFAARGRTVTALTRLSFGPLTLDDDLSPGSYRELNTDEIAQLYSAVGFVKGEDA